MKTYVVFVSTVSVAQKIAGCVLHLIAKVTRISYAKFYGNRLTNVQDIIIIIIMIIFKITRVSLLAHVVL